jgi:hypothetical protein
MVLPCSRPRVAALMAMPWPAPATFGCGDEQHQCAGGDRCDDADHSGREDDHAEALGCRWCEPAAEGAPRALGAILAANTSPRMSVLRVWS